MMPNRLGPNRFSPSFSLVWQIRHWRSKAASPLAASPAARAAVVRQARAKAIDARIRSDSRATATPSPLVGEGRGGGSGGFGTVEPHSSTPTPNPSPQGGGEEFAAPLRRKLAPMGAAAAAKAVLAGVLFVLNPIRRSCLHMLPPARSCVVRLWALFATRSPVCSVSATDSKCIQTALDYTDGGGIRAAPGRRDKRRGAH